MLAPDRDLILGYVEVDGEIYLLAPVGGDGCYEAIRLADQCCVGTIGTSGWMWRLQSETPDLMQTSCRQPSKTAWCRRRRPT